MARILCLCLVIVANTAFGGIPDTMSCVVRVVCDSGQGSGVVFDDDEYDLLVLTAGHVVKSASVVHLYGYVNGHQTPAAVGYVVWCDLNGMKHDFDTIDDLALIRVPKSAFSRGDLPSIKRLAAANSVLADKSSIFSVGCPTGNWPSGFLGHVTSQRRRLFWFVPNIVVGRSGSPVFDQSGEVVLGIVIWYNDATGVSTAVSFRAIHDAIQKHHDDPIRV